MTADHTTDGLNGCYRQAIAALQYLAAHHRPSGGQEQFNAEHLLQIADEMKRSRSQAGAGAVTKEQIKFMVDRFLSWKLPEDFRPDAGISFKAAFNEHTAYPMRHEPIGTNLFDAIQADAMVRYMIDGMPKSLSTQDKPACTKGDVVEGKWVPKEPTLEMMKAGARTCYERQAWEPSHIYRAMVAAAPALPTAAGVPGEEEIALAIYRDSHRYEGPWDRIPDTEGKRLALSNARAVRALLTNSERGEKNP